ncbi:MAG TPA: multiheme c-type cytochrome [Planctomycetota bacterium]|nr:multiheme c-type cytochrome [Planctomycetota bacterium]
MLLSWAVLLGALGGILALLWWAVGPSGTRGGSLANDPRRGNPNDPTTRLAVLYSCDIEGRLAPYTCEEGTLGGIARMATMYGTWAKDRDYRILVDVGNSTLSAHEAAESVNAFTFKALDRLGYDAVNCGDNEAALGLQELRALAKEREFKLISANLVHAETRAPIFPTHHTVRRGGLEIAIIGILREDILPKHPGKGVRLISPAAALRSAINTVKSSADVIVVLAFLPPEEIYELARKHPEVQLFLGGLSPVTSAPVEVAGPRATPSSIVSYLGDQGCTVACLDCSFPKGLLPSATGRVALLDSSVPSDPAFQAIIAEFTAALSGKPVPGAKQNPKMPCTSTHVGSDVCKLCHIKEFYSWQGTTHAGAYVTLLQKGKQQDPTCLACHATGHMMPGGFDPDRPFEPPKAPEAGAPKGARALRSQDPLKGVGCECCHGGARHHLGIALKDRFATRTDPLLRPPPSRENCIRCHTPSRPCLEAGTTDTYDRAEYMEKIKHWD